MEHPHLGALMFQARSIVADGTVVGREMLAIAQPRVSKPLASC